MEAKQQYKKQKDRPFEVRQKEAQKHLSKHPEYIPIVLEKSHKSKSLGNLPQQCKFLLPKEFTILQVSQIVRKQLGNIRKEDSVFVFANGQKLLFGNNELQNVYDNYKEKDGYLYLEYCELESLGYSSLQQYDQQNFLKNNNIVSNNGVGCYSWQ